MTEYPAEFRAEVLSTRAQLFAYCKANHWAGYDPYDALNSKLFKTVPPLNSRWPRLAMTQLLKRSPINLRPLLGIPKTQNPKALGLFLESALLFDGSDLERSVAGPLVERLIALRSPEEADWCWGYSFPWQCRSVLVPAGAANLVCTTFVAAALTTAYEELGDRQCLSMARSAADYIVKRLYWEDGEEAGFSYPLPSLRSQVHNANFLAAALLCRLMAHTGDRGLLDPALRAARYSARKQRIDGSWWYGELPTQRWIDNFHTGYNLCALRSIGLSLGTDEFEECVKRGFDFYRLHFFREDGAPRYFHDRTYPIDIHAVAQSLITLAEFSGGGVANLDLAARIFRWAKQNMWDERGYYYYRFQRFGTVRTSYMRWSQAWMLAALTRLSNVGKESLSPEQMAGAEL